MMSMFDYSVSSSKVPLPMKMFSVPATKAAMEHLLTSMGLTRVKTPKYFGPFSLIKLLFRKESDFRLWKS